MTDQCKNCDLIGNFNGCVNAECFLHENWYSIQLQQQKNRMVLTLKELQQFNRLRNDIDAYLYELVEWGLGNKDKHPDINDYK
jgi:hypothetical protein